MYIHYVHSLKVIYNFIGAKLLFRKLWLQMANCVKDNKNYHSLAFLFFLIVKKMFVKIQLWFLVTIGFTHEDIDGDLGYLSKKLK
jgi:hypothetical protein